MNQGKYDAAIADFNKVLELHPNDPNTYYNRGIAYGGRGKDDQAVADFNKALELDPRNFAVYGSRGRAYGRQGQYDAAIADYNKVLELHPNDIQAYFERGRAYIAKKAYKQALRDFTKVLENPSIDSYSITCEYTPVSYKACVYYNIGNIYLIQGNAKMAIVDYDKALQMQRYFSEVYFKKAEAYEKLGNSGDALALYKIFANYTSYPPLFYRSYKELILKAQTRIGEIEKSKIR